MLDEFRSHNSSKEQKLKESIGGKRTQFFVHGCFSYKVLQSSLRLKAKGVSDIMIARIIGASSLSFLGGSELTASDRSCAINVISVSLRIKGMQMSLYFNLMIQTSEISKVFLFKSEINLRGSLFIRK